jgi:transcriptional regulator with XRE-family HTH domain
MFARVKKVTNPVDKHVGRRVRMRRMMLAMSQGNWAMVGLTFQQVQKYEKGTNRIGASRLQQISHILQVPVAFFFEGAPPRIKGGAASRSLYHRSGACP